MATGSPEPPEGSTPLPTDPPPAHGRTVGRNIGALMSSQVITWVLAMVVYWIVPRFLGPDAFGRLRLAGSVWAIAMVLCMFGTSTFLTVEIAKQPQTARSLLSAVLRFRFWLYLLAWPAIGVVLLVGSYDRRTVEVMVIAGVATGFMLASSTYESGLHGLQEMGATARVHIAAKIFVTAGTVLVVVAGGGLIPVALVSAGGTLLAAVMLGRAARQRTQPGEPTAMVGRALAIVAAPFLLTEATRVVYQQIDTVIISLIADAEDVGYYATADTLFGSLLFVPVVVTTAMFPAIAELHHRAPLEVDALLRRAFNTLLLCSIPIGLGTIVVAPSFIRLVYGDGFADAAPVLGVFGVVIILSGQTILFGRFALATGRVKLWATVMVVVTVLSVPLDMILVPWTDRRFDNAAIGGALAFVVTEAILVTFGSWKVASGLYNRFTILRILRCGLAGAAMVLASWPFRDLLFVVPGAIAVITYAVVVVAIGTLTTQERDLVGRATAKLGAGLPRPRAKAEDMSDRGR